MWELGLLTVLSQRHLEIALDRPLNITPCSKHFFKVICGHQEFSQIQLVFSHLFFGEFCIVIICHYITVLQPFCIALENVISVLKPS